MASNILSIYNKTFQLDLLEGNFRKMPNHRRFQNWISSFQMKPGHNGVWKQV